MKIKVIIIFLLIVATAGFLLQQGFIQKTLSNFLSQSIPWSIPTFTYIKDNVLAGSLVGLIIYLVFVNIPLLPSLPAEAYAIFAFSKGTNILGILITSTLIYMLFALTYYFVGRLYGKRILERLLKRPVEYSALLDRFIGPIIFFAYLLPIPVPVPIGTISILLAGSYKTRLAKVMAAAGMGTLLRFLIVIILYNFFTPAIEQYLSPLKTLKIG